MSQTTTTVIYNSGRQKGGGDTTTATLTQLLSTLSTTSRKDEVNKISSVQGRHGRWSPPSSGATTLPWCSTGQRRRPGMKRILFVSALGSVAVVFLNFHAFFNQQYSKSRPPSHREEYSLLGSEFFAKPETTTLSSPRSEDLYATDSLAGSLIGKVPPPVPTRRAKVIMGIITADMPNDKSYRKRHRELFRLWNDKRVCSLPEFETSFAQQEEAARSVYYDCELIYTFIIGANPDPNGPTELVQQNASFPLLVTKPIKARQKDINDPDTTLLNIRENMNEGKSQTFLYFASLLMDKYGIDYAMKCDADSLLHLHDYFKFAHRNLPPAPFNTNIYVGALRDKAYWPKHDAKDMPRFESYFGNEFEGVHLYIAGQCYIVSHDLAAFVAKEALNSRGYVEGHEDHDISTMIFHSNYPVHMVAIAKRQRFWEHPVKGEPRWKRIWQRESSRMSGVPFEGKTLAIY